MSIYITDERCIDTIRDVEKRFEQDIEYTNDINPQRDKEMLRKKDVFLIDVYNTFIMPCMDRLDDLVMATYGTVKFIEDRKIRDGFPDFIMQYQGMGKRIAIHSDSFTQEEFSKADDIWKFKNYVERYFGEDYMTDIRLKKEHSIKDIGRMVHEMGIKKDDALIIGDGLSDILPAVHFGMDLLLVPAFSRAREFDYRRLI